jgi:hypothetical protein
MQDGDEARGVTGQPHDGVRVHGVRLDGGAGFLDRGGEQGIGLGTDMNARRHGPHDTRPARRLS